MSKIWFVLIGDKREGPYSFEDLKDDARITPDTFVWKEGFEDWKKISEVPELKDLFKDGPEPKEIDGIEEAEAPVVNKPAEGELTMAMQEPPYLLWILIALVSLLYVILQLQR